MAPIFNVSARKVGGLRFLRVGRLSVSFCLTRKPVQKPAPAPRFYVRPTMETRNGATFAGLRLYRNGKLAAVQWCAEGFAWPGEAWAHAQAAAIRSGFAVAR